MYFNKELHRGYNAYIDTAADDLGTRMDIGLLVMEEGDEYGINDPVKETAVLLFEGDIELTWGEKHVEASRPDCFHYEAYCLLAPRNTEIRIKARSHAEIYLQQTDNERDYEAVLYTPETVQTQHAGANGELMGTMQREIKTFFDLDNAPFSNMVLGEVLNAAVYVLVVIIHDHNVHAEVVLRGNRRRPVAQILLLVGIENARIVADIVDARLGMGTDGETEDEREYQEQGRYNSFHCSPPPYRKYRIAAITAATPPEMPANQPQALPFETGRSPMSLPVCPFMANR